jgi:hypothetical protein
VSDETGEKPAEAKPEMAPEANATKVEPKAEKKPKDYTRAFVVGLGIIGLVGRCIFSWLHDPREYIGSDMKLYIDMARRWANPGYVLTAVDVTHPPAGAMMFSYLYRWDPTLKLATFAMLFLSLCVPPVMFALGKAAFDRKTGWALFGATAIYFPFVDYGGYFLTEIPMTLLVTGTIATMLWTTKQTTTKRVIGGAVAAGLLCSAAITFKFVALPCVLCLAILFVLVPNATIPRKVRIGALAALLLAATPLTFAASRRCTKANNGHICFVSNKGPADFLLGHHGRFELLEWHDEAHRATILFGSPAAYQHGYRERQSVNFAITDGEKNAAEAWSFIKRYPAESFTLSIEHVYDLFGTMPWPSIMAGFWPMTEIYHYVFLLFVFFPALLLFYEIAREKGLKGLLASREVLVISPIAGLFFSVMVATGEARYRIPFDGLFFVCAVEFYRRYAKRKTAT